MLTSRLEFHEFIKFNYCQGLAEKEVVKVTLQIIVNQPAPKETQLLTFESHLLLTGKLLGIQLSQKHR